MLMALNIDFQGFLDGLITASGCLVLGGLAAVVAGE